MTQFLCEMCIFTPNCHGMGKLLLLFFYFKPILLDSLTQQMNTLTPNLSL